jgi:hypothetical protein
MASVADFGSTEANDLTHERRGPSPWVAGLLTVLAPGLGHIYLGEARRGITLFILVMIADTLLMFAMMGVLARFWMFAVSLSLLAGLWLYILIDAVRRAYRLRDYPHPSPKRWTIYAGAFVIACLVFAAPCIYAVHAQAGTLHLCRPCPSLGPAAGAQCRNAEHGTHAAGGRIFSR